MLPVVVLIFFAIVQGAVTLHAGNVAHAVGEAALEEATRYGGTAESGIEVGTRTAAAAGTALDDVAIRVVREGESVSVTVSGRAPSFIPGMPIDVSRTVTGPVERWVP